MKHIQNNSNDKLYRAEIVDKYVNGEMDRRSFLSNAGKLGLGAAALVVGMKSGLRGGFISPAHAADINLDADMMAWLKDVSKPFRGQTIRLATESTPPSNAINSALKPFLRRPLELR